MWVFDIESQEWNCIARSENEITETEETKAETDRPAEQPLELYIRPLPRMSHASCLDLDLCSNRVYLFGGSGINIGTENYNDLWEFDLLTLKFKEVNQHIKNSGQNRPPGMYGHSLSYHKNNLYVFGGTTGYEYFKDIYKYDLIINTWQKLQIQTPNSEM